MTLCLVRLRISSLLLIVAACAADDAPPTDSSEGGESSLEGSSTTATMASTTSPMSTTTSATTDNTAGTSTLGTSTTTTDPVTTVSAATSLDDDDSSEAEAGTSSNSTTSGDSSTTGVDIDPAVLAAYSDDFEGTELVDWSVLRPELSDISVAGGQLHVEPQDNSLWFNATAATQIYRELEASAFRVTSHVVVRRLSDPSLPPEPQYRLGGIMARNAQSNAQDYVFIVLGADANDVSVETKTTVDSVSTFVGPPWPSGEGDLRLCRLGSTFHLLIREAGDPWTLQETYERPDFGAELAVGPVAYANANPADVRVSYDGITFAPASDMDDCMAD